MRKCVPLCTFTETPWSHLFSRFAFYICVYCSCFVFCIFVCAIVHVCDVAHFVWPRVRSFLRDFTVLLVIPPRGKGPNHTLLPVVMQYVLHFQKLSTSISNKSQDNMPHAVSKGRSFSGQLTKIRDSTSCGPSWSRDVDGSEWKEQKYVMGRERGKSQKYLASCI